MKVGKPFNAQWCSSGNPLASTSAASLSTVLTGSAFGHIHTMLEYLQSKMSDLQTMPMAELVVSTFVQAPSESPSQPTASRLLARH